MERGLDLFFSTKLSEPGDDLTPRGIAYTAFPNGKIEESYDAEGKTPAKEAKDVVAAWRKATNNY